MPALQASRPDLTTTLKEGGRSSTTGAAGQRLRSALVVVEVALAVVLLVGAGLFIGSFVRLMQVDPGFDYGSVLALDVGIRVHAGNFQEASKRGRLYVQQMLEAVARVPGVEMAGAVNGGLPLTGSWNRTKAELPGQGELKGDDDSIDRRTVSAGYLKLLRVPLVRGRHLTEQDSEGAQPVVVINQAAARKYWGIAIRSGSASRSTTRNAPSSASWATSGTSVRKRPPARRRISRWRRIKPRRRRSSCARRAIR